MALNIVIVGGGKVGSHLAGLLLESGSQVALIELRSAEAHRLAEALPGAFVLAGSGADPAMLERAGVRRADVVAAVTGNDETNLVVTSLARFESGVRRTIGRVNNPKNAWMFTGMMGVDVALSPADLMAHLIAEEMSLGDMMTLLKLRRGSYALVEEQLPSSSAACGRAVHELDLPRECVLTAIIRGGRLIIPRGDTVLRAGDEVLALVHSAAAGQLAAALGPRR